MIEQIHDICELIGSFCDSNGSFQHHVAFDLRDRDIANMTVSDLAGVIQAASDRYNRMHGKKVSEMTTDDRNWGFRYGRWANV